MDVHQDYGRTRAGKPITDELIEELAKKAEEGFDVDEIIRRRGGRPPMGAGVATVESVRLEPELRDALRERAEREGRDELGADPRGATLLPPVQLSNTAIRGLQPL